MGRSVQPIGVSVCRDQQVDMPAGGSVRCVQMPERALEQSRPIVTVQSLLSAHE